MYLQIKFLQQFQQRFKVFGVWRVYGYGSTIKQLKGHLEGVQGKAFHNGQLLLVLTQMVFTFYGRKVNRLAFIHFIAGY